MTNDTILINWYNSAVKITGYYKENIKIAKEKQIVE
jgi:hypothetical protein